MSVFYQIVIWILVVLVAWLMFAAINILKTEGIQNRINDTLKECLELLLKRIEKGGG